MYKKRLKLSLLFSLLLACSISCSSPQKGNTEDGKQDSEILNKNNLTDNDIKEAETDTTRLSNSDNKIEVIDFFATWCGPCKQLSPYFEKWANTYKNNVVFTKIDIDVDQMLADEYDVNAVPTIVILAPDGTMHERIVGFNPQGIEDAIKRAIESKE